MHKLVFTFFILLLVSALTAQAKPQTKPFCSIPKSNHLEIDQRDDFRMKCLKQKKSVLKISQCLSIAQSMEYSTNAEDARLFCLYNLRISLNECFDISNSMEYPDTGDEVRWDCITRFSKTISVKQCKKLAKNMNYPANAQRADLYCSDELQ